MTHQPITYFGIDLGTTNSAACYLDKSGTLTVVRDLDCGSDLTPSTVYFQDAANVIVGRTAKDFAQMDPRRVVTLVKRMMGEEHEWEHDGLVYTPESISALILKQLKQNAERHTGHPATHVVITVPAYFGLRERGATHNAGIIAGFTEIGLVPEPVAAALHYESWGGTDRGDRTILVYDLGGGTFDSTVIRVDGGAMEVLGTDGDQRLGGANWDERLCKYILGRFEAEVGPSADDAGDDERFLQQLAAAAEDAKCALSEGEDRSVELRYGAATARVPVSRSVFESITADLVDRTVVCIRRLLANVQKTRADTTVDEILLVGGATRMPMIANRLRTEFGLEPLLFDPDLAVVKGAAWYARSRGSHWKWTDDARRNDNGHPAPAPPRAPGVDPHPRVHTVTGVLPRAFGIRAIDTAMTGSPDAPDNSEYVHHLVHANDPLPSGPHILTVTTVEDNQRVMQIELYEQAGVVESTRLSANQPISSGAGTISGLPPGPAGSVDVAVTMQIDGEGRLTLTATESTTGRELVIDVGIGALDARSRASARSQIQGIAVKG